MIREILLVFVICLEILTWQHTPLCLAYQNDEILRQNEGNYPYRTDHQTREPYSDGTGVRSYGDDLGNLGTRYSQQNYNPSGGQGYAANKAADNPAGSTPTWQPVYPFPSIWTIQSAIKPAMFITPYYLIDLPNRRYLDRKENNCAYQFRFDTGNFRKAESSTEDGRIQGRFEFADTDGRHAVSYTSTQEDTFQFTNEGGSDRGGNMYHPLYTSVVRENSDFSNRQNQSSYNDTAISGLLETPFEDSVNTANINISRNLQELSMYLNKLLDSYYVLPYERPQNRSYYFLFDAGATKTEERSDLYGNIRGYFQYVDEAGYHDLRYISSPSQGFQVVGGNLACPMPCPAHSSTPTNDRGRQYGSRLAYGDRRDEEVKIVIGKAIPAEGTTDRIM